MNYPIESIRNQFPALSQADEQGQIPLLLDGPGGSQVPKKVLQAITDYLGCYNSNLGGYADAGLKTQAINQAARIAAADWLGCEADEIVFGLNSTSLMFNISRAVSQTWQSGDNIIVSSLDHFSHVSSWQRAAEDRGVEVRTLPLSADGTTLNREKLADLIDDKTRLFAFSLASNVLGTIPDAAELIQTAKQKGALVSLDGVHAAVHRLLDAKVLDCDFLFASAYKLGGPHLGIMHAKRKHLTEFTPYKVEPAADTAPNRWEQGTQSFEAQAGFVAMIDYWAKLGGSNASSRRAALAESYRQVEAYEQSISARILAHIAQRPYIQLYGRNSETGRTPTFAFNLVKDGKLCDAAAVSRWFGAKNIALGAGNFYALDVVRHLGLTEHGFLRIGCLHYTTAEEIDRFFKLLDDYAKEIGCL